MNSRFTFRSRWILFILFAAITAFLCWPSIYANVMILLFGLGKFQRWGTLPFHPLMIVIDFVVLYLVSKFKAKVSKEDQMPIWGVVLLAFILAENSMEWSLPLIEESGLHWLGNVLDITNGAPNPWRMTILTLFFTACAILSYPAQDPQRTFRDKKAKQKKLF